METEELLTRGVANIIANKEELEKKLSAGKKLNVYLGIDPTSTRIHLGHAVVLRKLQAFAEAGHNVTFIIGDFTALIGDTSDKESERPALTVKEIRENFKTYQSQAEKILDFSKITVKYNSEWLRRLTFEEIVKLTQHFSVGDFAGRELIRKRLTENKRVGLHEFLYPVMQGYDSYHLDTDVQVGGTDQTFNMQAGRTLQKDLREKESFIITTPILEGNDGRKMSKSWGNAIWLDDSPYDMYAKVMAVDDPLIVQYFTLATSLPLDEISALETRLSEKKEHPMKAKKKLARQIVTELYNQHDAEKAERAFENIVQKDEVPSDIPTIVLQHAAIEKATITEVLANTNLVLSKSDAKRLIEQGGVKVNEETINDFSQKFITLVGGGETTIQIGKRKFLKVKIQAHSE